MLIYNFPKVIKKRHILKTMTSNIAVMVSGSCEPFIKYSIPICFEYHLIL